jgi:hypothetical protein
MNDPGAVAGPAVKPLRACAPAMGAMLLPFKCNTRGAAVEAIERYMG